MSPSRPGTEPTPRFAIAACMLAALPTVIHASTQRMFGGVATDIRQEFGATNASMGIMAAAIGLAAVVLAPGAGALVDRLGARRTLTAASFGYGACCAWFVLSGSVPNSTASRLFMGLFAAFMYPGFIAVIARLVETARRQRAISLMQLSVGLSAILASLAATPVLAADSWRIALAVPVGLFFVLGAIQWRTFASPSLRPRRSGEPRARPLSVREVLAVPDVRRACIVAIGTGGVMLALGGMLNGVVSRVVWKLPEETWGLVNAAFFLGFAVGGTVLVRITRGIGLPRTLRGTILFLAGSIVAWAYLPLAIGAPAACAVTFCCGLGTSAMSIAVTVAIRAVPVDSVGIAAGVVGSAMALGGMVMEAGSMATGSIPGSTPAGRVTACGVAMIAVVLCAYAAARRIGDAPAALAAGAHRQGQDRG